MVTGDFPSQMPVTRSFDVFVDLRLNKRLGKQLRRRWFETLSRSLWRHSDGKLAATYPTIRGIHMKYNIDVLINILDHKDTIFILGFYQFTGNKV